MNRIIEPLQQMGVRIEGSGGCAPLFMQAAGGLLTPIDYRLPVASAQVKSCLLLAGLAADGVTRLEEPGPSRDHTERMLKSMGVKVIQGQDHAYWTSITPPEQRMLVPLDLTLPGDISAAAFLIVAASIVPDSSIILRGVGINPTRTGLLEALIEMGAKIEIKNAGEQGGEPIADLEITYRGLHGVHVRGDRVVRMIDEFPAFAVAAACAEGETVVAEAEELRYKESDRITSLGGELKRLGIAFEETADGFKIKGGGLIEGGQVESHGDHRLAMSLALAGLVSRKPVLVSGADMIHESFPDYAAVLAGLGADIHTSQ
jgi:3-phosphoshikimate 1-carboxyvinyltransferase